MNTVNTVNLPLPDLPDCTLGIVRRMRQSHTETMAESIFAIAMKEYARQAQREAVAAYKAELFQKYESSTERATEAEGDAFTHGYLCGESEAVAGPDGWEANAQFLLDKCPYTVWQRPGAGPIDLLSTLVVTFSGMQMRLQGHPMFADENKSEAVAAAVPDGWKLVPIEPTQEMCVVDFDCDDSVGIDSARIIYKAMLTASPEVKP